MKYSIYFDNKLVGYTDLESADPSMGVVFGKISFNEISDPFGFIHNYCINNKIVINSIDLEVKFISTQNIHKIKVISNGDQHIEGLSSSITRMENDGYQLEIIGIPYPLYSELFPNHVYSKGKLYD